MQSLHWERIFGSGACAQLTEGGFTTMEKHTRNFWEFVFVWFFWFCGNWAIKEPQPWRTTHFLWASDVDPCYMHGQGSNQAPTIDERNPANHLRCLQPCKFQIFFISTCARFLEEVSATVGIELLHQLFQHPYFVVDWIRRVQKNMWNCWGWMFINVVFLPFRTDGRSVSDVREAPTSWWFYIASCPISLEGATGNASIFILNNRHLGSGFIFFFSPLLWGRFRFWQTFFKWVVQPPTRNGVYAEVLFYRSCVAQLSMVQDALSRRLQSANEGMWCLWLCCSLVGIFPTMDAFSDLVAISWYIIYRCNGIRCYTCQHVSL